MTIPEVRGQLCRELDGCERVDGDHQNACDGQDSPGALARQDVETNRQDQEVGPDELAEALLSKFRSH